jgi:ubiquinone/menaquinone biosynthesis C-methylase UbiE
MSLLRSDKIGRNVAFNYLKNYLKKSDTILDVGSGTGIIAQLIKEKIGANIKCIDVIDISKTDIPLKIYDGKNIPYKNNSFSAVMCNFVLHHCEDLEKVIEEMKRVSKSKILILEDIPESLFDKFFIKFHALFSKISYGSKNMEFYNIKGWKNIFRKHKLKLHKIVKIKRFMPFWYPVTRRLFILKK